MAGKRYLVVTADDFGIGPATSQAILDLAFQGRVRGAVLLVNAPHAVDAVRAWRRCGEPVELGWHPCLTLDRPILPGQRVPSLVTDEGHFWPLGAFLRRLLTGRIRRGEIEAELRAQLDRYQDLLGQPPSLVNSHHHIQIFAPIGGILQELLGRQRPLPYVRRVREPVRCLLRVPGARGKRVFLSVLGRRAARRLDQAGFPGNDWLAGVTDPPSVAAPDFLARWLRCLPGEVVELTCHPGYPDATLIGRDCIPGDGQLQRRLCEFQLLSNPRFPDACHRARLILAAPSELRRLRVQGGAYAA